MRASPRLGEAGEMVAGLGNESLLRAQNLAFLPDSQILATSPAQPESSCPEIPPSVCQWPLLSPSRRPLRPCCVTLLLEIESNRY